MTIDGPKPTNGVLSYQLVVECGGRRAAVIVYTEGLNRHHRLRLERLLEIALRRALRKGVIPAFPDRLTVFGHGAVAKAVGNRERRLQRDDGIGSGGEVNHAFGWWLTEALPAIDLAHADLA